jgi:hypothetical protein
VRLLEHQHAGDAVRHEPVHDALDYVCSGSVCCGEHQLREPFRVVQKLSVATVELEQEVLGECVHGLANLRPS